MIKEGSMGSFSHLTIYTRMAVYIALLSFVLTLRYPSCALSWTDGPALESLFGAKWAEKFASPTITRASLGGIDGGSAFMRGMRVIYESTSIVGSSTWVTSMWLVALLTMAACVEALRLLANAYFTLKTGEKPEAGPKCIDLTNSKPEVRISRADELAEAYYYFITGLYEIAWGNIFQIGVPFGFYKESYGERARRRCYWLAARVPMSRGKKCLDLGCGVGGPLQTLVRFTGADITGITICTEQVVRGNAYLVKENLQKYGRLQHGDYCQLEKSFPKSSMDIIYSFEALVHTKDIDMVMRGVYHTLKPGGEMACLEWLRTDIFDEKNTEHIESEEALREISGIPQFISVSTFRKAVINAGLEIVEEYDMEEYYDDLLPEKWYSVFEYWFSVRYFLMCRCGAHLMTALLWVLALLGLIAPKLLEFQVKMSKQIVAAAKTGSSKCISIQYYFKFRKPLTAQ